MTRGLRRRFRGLAGWMAAGVCASVALLTGSAITPSASGSAARRCWSSGGRTRRRISLVTALTRDMHAVQKSVLASPDWDAFTLDPRPMSAT